LSNISDARELNVPPRASAGQKHRFPGDRTTVPHGSSLPSSDDGSEHSEEIDDWPTYHHDRVDIPRHSATPGITTPGTTEIDDDELAPDSQEDDRDASQEEDPSTSEEQQ
jgi:hypothetical protein